MKTVLNTLLFCCALSAQTVNPSQIMQSGAKTGHAAVYGTFWKPALEGVPPPCPITATTVVTCTHNFNTRNVYVAVWDSSGYLVRAATVTRGLNSVTVTFSAAFTGIVVIK